MKKPKTPAQRSKRVPNRVIFDPILPDGRVIKYSALRGWYIKGD